MKKIVALFMTLAISVIFVACGASQSSSSSEPESSSSESTSSETVNSKSSSGFQIDDSQLNNLGKPQHEMSVTSDEIIKAIDAKLANTKYLLLSKQLPRKSKDKDSYMGITDESEYDLGDGFILSLYANPDNKKLTRIEFFVLTSNATKDSINYYACCADTVIKYLDPDNADKIEKKLNLSNISTNENNYADTENYSYSYSVTDGTDVLMIEPQR